MSTQKFNESTRKRTPLKVFQAVPFTVVADSLTGSPELVAVLWRNS